MINAPTATCIGSIVIMLCSFSYQFGQNFKNLRKIVLSLNSNLRNYKL